MKKLTIDGAFIESREALHDLLARELQFPLWYGKNLDALADCLGDVTEETVIEINGGDLLCETLGGYAKAFFRVLSDAAENNPSLRIVFDGEKGGKI